MQVNTYNHKLSLCHVSYSVVFVLVQCGFVVISGGYENWDLVKSNDVLFDTKQNSNNITHWSVLGLFEYIWFKSSWWCDDST